MLQNWSIQSQRGFILATLYNEKTSDRSLNLRLLFYLKEIDLLSRNNKGLIVLVNRSDFF